MCDKQYAGTEVCKQNALSLITADQCSTLIGGDSYGYYIGDGNLTLGCEGACSTGLGYEINTSTNLITLIGAPGTFHVEHFNLIVSSSETSDYSSKVFKVAGDHYLDMCA